MAERIVSTSSSRSSLQEEMDEKQTNDCKQNLKPKENNKKESKKSKSSKKERQYVDRFLGDGVSFKAKLIGVRDVPQARGEKMSQETLQELKLQKKSSGEHKQKILITVSLEGLKIKEEKTKELLYFHEVHKISFISQDASDNRAFGYIYGSPDNLHTFFAIKTEKAAQQIVICMRDLFHVAFELKKKEIEQWRLQQQATHPMNNRSPSTSLGSQSNDGSVISDSSVKSRDASSPMSLNSSSSGSFNSSSRESESSFETAAAPAHPPNTEGPVSLLLDLVADTPKGEDIPIPVEAHNGDPFFSDPWGYLRTMSKAPDSRQVDPFLVVDSSDFQAAAGPAPYFEPANTHPTVSSSLQPLPSSDPFNTSFVNTPFGTYTSTPVPIASLTPVVAESPDPTPSPVGCDDKYAALAEISSINVTAGGVTSDSGSGVAGQVTSASVAESGLLNNAFVVSSPNDGSLMADATQPFGRSQLNCSPQTVVVPETAFSDLDPLGKNRPYIDKKDFFHDVKNPPKKVLKDLIAENTFAVPEFDSQVGETITYQDEPPSCPPSHAPPPLPPQFFHRSLTSPTASLEDASMVGSSASSTSSVGSDAPSPVSEVLLPPPPPPPPRPHANFPAFLPPPPPLPPKHGSSHSSRSSDGSSSPTSDFPPEIGRLNAMMSSPPIPIPTRRGRMSFVSSSSTSMSSSSSSSSAQHGGILYNTPSMLNGNTQSDPNNNPPQIQPSTSFQSFWTDSSSTFSDDTKTSAATWNDIKRAAAIIAANNRELVNQNETEALANHVNQLNLSNPFSRDIFLSPPPQTNGPRRQTHGLNGNLKYTKTGIFEKEGDPFGDDDFFAALRSDNPQANAVPRMANDNRTVWNSPFEDNFEAQNR